MKKTLLVVALAFALTTSAFAMEVPTETVVQNLNGSQQYIKTYTVAPETDPESLIEAPFNYEGFTYTYASMTKQENRIEDKTPHTETVTVETAKKDLSVVLAALEPTIAYDDGQYCGTLALDHSTISTEAAGYTSKNYAVSDTKTYESLPSNDMAQIPATSVKDGVTLNLASVDWQVQSTALVDDVLMPSLYRAVASYSATAWYSAATGYISTAEYTGTVTRSGVESVTYTLTYIGKETVPEPNETQAAGTDSDHSKKGLSALIPAGVSPWLIVGGGAAMLAIIALAVLLVLSKREIARLREADAEEIVTEDAGYEETEERE